MDNKTWLWKKRPSEKKTTVANGDEHLTENVEELQLPPNENELALQKTVDILNEKLVSVIGECSAKVELVTDYAMKAEEALAGQQRAELEAVRLKEELNEALQERIAENERTSKLNAALKDCMQQLNSLREDQDRRVRDAAVRESGELEKAYQKLEERLKMMNKMVTNLNAENSQMSEALIEKEMLVEDLSKCRKQAEAEFETLMARLDTVEKENAFLRYEFRMVEKDLDIRNEEMKISRYSLDASNKQCMESLRKVKKLEAECQRLRVLVRKRLPGPAALIKMSREVELSSGNQIQTRPTNWKPITGGSVIRDLGIQTPADNSSNKMHLLTDHLRDVEEQNKILREMLKQKDSAITYSDKGISRPTDIDAQAIVQDKVQEAISSPNSSYNIFKDHKILSSPSSTSSSSWAIEKLKHEDLKDASEHKMLGIPDMSLMDDFVEMEKLAIVTVDSSTEESKSGTPTCKELVPVQQSDARASLAPSDWLQHVTNTILEQHHASGRSLNELVEDIGMAVQKNSLGVGVGCQTLNSIVQNPVSGLVPWKSSVTSPRFCPTDTSINDKNLVQKPINSILESSLGSSISKIIEIVGGLHLDCPSESVTEEEPSTVCSHQPFLDTCQKVLDGDVNFEKFAEELASDLTLIFNNHAENSEQSKETIKGLLTELEMLRESKRISEDQFENQKSINEDLDTQLTVSKAKVTELLQKLSTFEIELEDKNHRCEALEGTCLELQLLLESITHKETHKDNFDKEGNLLPKGWELSAASMKLEECQDTILELGKQLKALTSSKETTVAAKLLTASSPNTDHKRNCKLSLLDQMQHDDTSDGEKKLMPPKTKQTANTTIQRDISIATPNVGALAIVPIKKRGGAGSFLKKLLLKRKKGSARKPLFS